MQYYYYLIGAACGFSYFVYQTTTIGNVYIRPNEYGEKTFHLSGIIPYLKLPFTQNVLYIDNISDLKSLTQEEIIARFDLLKLNWIFTTGVGTFLIGTTLDILNF